MAAFEVFQVGVEVNGKTIMSIIKGMGAFKSQALVFLKDAGVADLVDDDKHWYLQENFLKAFKKISDELGDFSLLGIGRAIPTSATFPPVNSLQDALAMIDVAYHINHRNRNKEVLFEPGRKPKEMLEGIGHYTFISIDDNNAKVACENPYPCKFDEGIIKKMAEIAKGKGFVNRVNVVHDNNCDCRKKWCKKLYLFS